jgi:Las1-like
MSANKKAPQSLVWQRQHKRLRVGAQLFPSECVGEEHDAVGRALLSVSQFLQNNGSGNKSQGAETSGNEVNSSCGEFQRATSMRQDGTFSIAEALERVAVWKIRSPQIAHAIESTAALAQILYRESISAARDAPTYSTTSSTHTGIGTLSTVELRHAYACAILRTINGLADTLQQQRAVAASVATLCAELGVPQWLVSIRHQATHNQLPPLVTLRMAAHALLQYLSTVYWEPMARRRQHWYQQALSLLKEYTTVAQNDQALKRQRRNEQNTPTVPDKDLTDRTDECSSSEDETEVQCVNGLWQSVPGTTSNRFAPLVEPKTKPPAGKTGTVSRGVLSVSPRMEPANTSTGSTVAVVRDPNQPTAWAMAEKYLASSVPVDVLYMAMLDYLVYGFCKENDDGNSERSAGLLLGGDFNATVDELGPLLIVFGRNWPGLVSALLIASVNVICQRMETPSNATASSGASDVLEQWIRHLLSRKFISKIFKYSGEPHNHETKVNGVSYAPLSVLKILQIPLNRLCDRLVHANRSGTRPVAKALSDLFCALLGDERCAHYGITGIDTLPEVPAEGSVLTVKAAVSSNEIPQRPTESVPLSLDAMEALLSGDHPSMDLPQGDDEKSPDVPPRDSVATASSKPLFWVRCSSWEPCALGTNL